MLEKPSPGMKFWGCFDEFCVFVLLGVDVEYNHQRVFNLHSFVGCPVIYPVENVKRSFFFSKLTAVMIRSTRV